MCRARPYITSYLSPQRTRITGAQRRNLSRLTSLHGETCQTERVETYASLVGHLCPEGRLLAESPLKGGVSAAVTSLLYERPDGAQSRVVVRRYDSQARTANLRSEYELMTALSRSALPVPAPIAWVDDLFPTPALVLPFVEGQNAPDASEVRLQEMARTLATIHSIDIRLPKLPSRDETTDILEFMPETGFGPLRDRRPRLQPRPAVLCHGDFWWRNLLWHQGRLTAILDWEDAAIGDPLSDLAGARLELLWSAGDAAANRFTALYLAQRAMDIADLPLWEIYVASAAATFMPQWGLEPPQLARLQTLTKAFLTRAVSAVLQRE